MSIKASYNENKDAILDSLPTQELKDAFLADLEKVEETTIPTAEEQIAEAQAPDYVSEELYENIKKEIESETPSAAASKEEEEAAIAEAMKNVPSE